MADVIERLGRVPEDGLPPASLDSVRKRAAAQRKPQRWAAGSALIALLVVVAVLLPRLPGEGDGAADAPTTSATPSPTSAVDNPDTRQPDEAPGTIATWVLEHPNRVTPESTTLDLLVTRIECASGYTGEVLQPVVTIAEDRITIRTIVEALSPGAALCPGNPYVPLTVELPEPVGDRLLVDDACRHPDLLTTVFCVDDGLRWQP